LRNYNKRDRSTLVIYNKEFDKELVLEDKIAYHSSSIRSSLAPIFRRGGIEPWNGRV